MWPSIGDYTQTQRTHFDEKLEGTPKSLAGLIDKDLFLYRNNTQRVKSWLFFQMPKFEQKIRIYTNKWENMAQRRKINL